MFVASLVPVVSAMSLPLRAKVPLHSSIPLLQSGRLWALQEAAMLSLE
jgi:hypothetical protein